MNTQKGILIIGIGNLFRGDDAVGLMVADELKKSFDESNLLILKQSGDAMNLMESWRGYNKVILVDACPYREQLGGFQRVRLSEDGHIPILSMRSSSHNFGVAEAIAFSKSLGSLPQEVIIYAIEGDNFAQGDDMNHEVRAAVPIVAEQIKNEIGEEKHYA